MLTLFRWLSLALWMISSLAYSQASIDEDLNFVYESGEQIAHQRCKVNFNRGDSCRRLLEKLCERIDYQNRDCRRIQVDQCHDQYFSDQTKEEQKCEKGAHAEPCYGIHKKCSKEERNYCRLSNFSGKYCKYYQWEYCRDEVGVSSNGSFRSLDCRKFHNKEMIAFHDLQTQKKLRWTAYGENRIQSQIPRLHLQKNQLSEAIDSIKDQIKSINRCLDLTIIAGCITGLTSRSQLKERKEKLRKKQSEYQKQLEQTHEAINEHQYAGELCEYFSPVKGNDDEL